MPLGVPTFSRVEIRTRGKHDLALASAELRTLATELDTVVGLARSDDDAVVLAQHKINTTSKKLRQGA